MLQCKHFTIFTLLVMLCCILPLDANADRFYSRDSSRNPADPECNSITVKESSNAVQRASRTVAPADVPAPQPQKKTQKETSSLPSQAQYTINGVDTRVVTSDMYRNAKQAGTVFESEEKAKAAFRAKYEDEFTSWTSSEKEKAAHIPHHTLVYGSWQPVEFVPCPRGRHSGYWGYRHKGRWHRYSVWNDPFWYERQLTYHRYVWRPPPPPGGYYYYHYRYRSWQPYNCHHPRFSGWSFRIIF